MVMGHFYIYHPLHAEINSRCKEKSYEYEEVCIIHCESLEEAVRLSQNDNCEGYASLGLRDTQIGDVIVYDNKHYLIKSYGFEVVSESFIHHIDWDKHLILNPV